MEMYFTRLNLRYDSPTHFNHLNLSVVCYNSRYTLVHTSIAPFPPHTHSITLCLHFTPWVTLHTLQTRCCLHATITFQRAVVILINTQFFLLTNWWDSTSWELCHPLPDRFSTVHFFAVHPINFFAYFNTSYYLHCIYIAIYWVVSTK